MTSVDKVLDMESMFLAVRAEKFAVMVSQGMGREAIAWARKTIPEELMQEFTRLTMHRMTVKGLTIQSLLEQINALH